MIQPTLTSCTHCGDAIPEGGDRRRKFCKPACRNRHNNALAKSRPVGPDEHGRRIGYARGCKCNLCLAFCAAEARRHRAANPKPPAPPRQRAGIKLGPRSAHGTSSRYKYGCRCELCQKAITAENNEWRRRNPEKFRANQSRYRRRNPDKVRGLSDARAAAPYDEDAIAYLDVIRLDPCVYCGGVSDTVDHIDPVSASMSSHWSNLAPACRGCNSSKGAKSVLGFLLYRMASPVLTLATT